MENRELGLTEMYERIKAARTELGLVSFRRLPTRPSELSDLPCVFMLEGPDRIIKRSSRGSLGYPATRILEVTFESVVNKRDSVNVKILNQGIRQAIFKIRGSDPPVYSSNLDDSNTNTVFIHEDRTEGPSSYGLPDIEVMRLIIDLTYIDGGL